MMGKYLHKVNYYETDKMGVTHHSNYIRIMEEARIDFFEKIGWGYDKFEAEGIISPVVSVSCDYIKTTTYPDIIEVEAVPSVISKLKFRFDYVMKCRGVVVCKAHSIHCFLNPQGRPIAIEESWPDFYAEIINYREV